MANDPGYQTVAEELGRPRPNFLAEALEEGARQQAAARAEAEAKKVGSEERMTKTIWVRPKGPQAPRPGAKLRVQLEQNVGADRSTPLALQRSTGAAGPY
jgi:hypothetical protein